GYEALAVLVVVVERDVDRVDALDFEVHAEALDERRLAGGRGAGDADEADRAPFGDDAVGNLGDALFVKALADADDLGDLAADAALGEGADALDADGAQPLAVRLGHLATEAGGCLLL